MTDPTAMILDYFEEINAIPRCSLNEEKLCRWLQKWATERNLVYHCDSAGNLVIRVPASSGYEKAPVVVIQGHMDMVCEKTPESIHNFETDPIVSHREGDWLTAQDTTLGADNGIAIAYMLALVDEKTIRHPPLQLLFTVDEETGLNGAKRLEPEFIEGRTLINLDSEDEGVFTIGCAGGVDTNITLAARRSVLSSGDMHRLIVGGLKGGHSGIDIHKGRGNANKLMARILLQLQSMSPLKLVSFLGGTRKNAIPRDAEAVFWMDSAKTDQLKQTVDEIAHTLQKEFAPTEKAFFVRLKPATEADVGQKALDRQTTEKFIQILLSLPDGVSRMSSELQGVVDTSSNLATVRLTEDNMTLLSSQRSASLSRLDEITATVHAVAKLAGAQAQDHDAYPPWQPRTDSNLLSRSKKTYRMLYGREPVIQVIHAGLECAVIGDIYQGMDMISFGPTIRNPHSPDERIWIPSIIQVWDFLVKLLEALE